jgi:hypothetical protein
MAHDYTGGVCAECRNQRIEEESLLLEFSEVTHDEGFGPDDAATIEA